MVGRRSVVAMEVPSCDAIHRIASYEFQHSMKIPIPSAAILRIASLEDFDYAAGAHGPATLADGEAQPLGHGDGLDQLDRHLGVIPRHGHLGPLGEGDLTGDIGGPEVELGPIVVEERG